jgi:hypothetical protein
VTAGSIHLEPSFLVLLKFHRDIQQEEPSSSLDYLDNPVCYLHSSNLNQQERSLEFEVVEVYRFDRNSKLFEEACSTVAEEEGVVVVEVDNIEVKRGCCIDSMDENEVDVVVDVVFEIVEDNHHLEGENVN